MPAARGIARILGFGEQSGADVRLLDCKLEATSSEVRVEILGERLDYRLGAPGRHWVQNSLGVLAAVAAARSPMSDSPPARSPPSARPRAAASAAASRSPAARFELIDESYNASPAAMRAALRRARPAPSRGRSGRRIAVLGDMLELGDQAPRLHADLAARLVAAGIDLVLHRRPADEAPARRRCRRRGAARTAADAAGAHPRRARRRCGRATWSWSRARSAAAWRRSSRPCCAGRASKRAAGRAPARPTAAEREAPMLYNLLAPLADEFTLFNLFRYLTFRSGGAVLTALLISFVLGAADDPLAEAQAARGPADPQRRAGIPSLTKKGTPTMGGVLILLAVTPQTLLWADLRNGFVWVVLLRHRRLRRHRLRRRLPEAHAAQQQGPARPAQAGRPVRHRLVAAFAHHAADARSARRPASPFRSSRTPAPSRLVLSAARHRASWSARPTPST